MARPSHAARPDQNQHPDQNQRPDRTQTADQIQDTGVDPPPGPGRQDGRGPGTDHRVVTAGPPPYWRRPACAPGLRFASRDGELIIRYRYAGRTRELRVPAALWAPFVEEVRHGRLDRLASIDGQPAWTQWGGGAGQAARCPPDEILLRYGAEPTVRESRLPMVIWDQILVAVRAHAIDDLDHPPLQGDSTVGARRPTGFLTLHGAALGPRGSAIGQPDRVAVPPPTAHRHEHQHDDQPLPAGQHGQEDRHPRHQQPDTTG
ncbi:hypothetical protein [Frankia canadensis]|uniref:hypothetical protein n=1 Tax=Frankia canadensis TaxID=1836972 RepID=UPI000C7D2B07|nr:hypothetical protein [Frankia canadensis]